MTPTVYNETPADPPSITIPVSYAEPDSGFEVDVGDGSARQARSAACARPG